MFDYAELANLQECESFHLEGVSKEFDTLIGEISPGK
jgi:hypothetical protein